MKRAYFGLVDIMAAAFVGIVAGKLCESSAVAFVASFAVAALTHALRNEAAK